MTRKVGPWMQETDDDGTLLGMYRAFEGTDASIISNRVAFIEKTPRIRIRPLSAFDRNPDFLNWASAPFKGNGPFDRKSMEWCDQALKLFGYDV